MDHRIPANIQKMLDSANDARDLISGIARIVDGSIQDDQHLSKDVASVIVFALRKVADDLSECTEKTELSLRSE